MTPLTKAMLVLGLGVMAWSAPLIAVLMSPTILPMKA